MYSIFTHIWLTYGANVGKYSIHGANGLSFHRCCVKSVPFSRGAAVFGAAALLDPIPKKMIAGSIARQVPYDPYGCPLVN